MQVLKNTPLDFKYFTQVKVLSTYEVQKLLNCEKTEHIIIIIIFFLFDTV